jgi:hypothetical protein
MPEFRLDQIANYLLKLNMNIDTIYTIDEDCIFLKIHMKEIADFFMLYISSRYTIYKSSEYNCVEIKYIDLTETEEVAEDFANINNEDDIEEDYDTIDNEDNNIESIVRSYNKQLEVKDYKKFNEFKEIVRLVKRLRYCVSNQTLKIGVMYNNLICGIKKDNSLDTYEFLKDSNSLRELYVFIDIDSFFKEEITNKFIDLSKTIKNGIYTLLKNNKNKNRRKMDIVFNKYKSSVIQNDLITETCEKLKTEQDNLYVLLLKNIKSQETIKQDMLKKEAYYNNKNTVTADIDSSRFLGICNKKLKKLQGIETQIRKSHLACKSKYENSILVLDKIYFENIVMFNSIINNLTELTNLK